LRLPAQTITANDDVKNRNAIVTLALGDQYHERWKEFCEPSWRTYAEKHGYDLICLEEPLDSSIRAKGRSPSWQKCLVLSQEFAQPYDRIVWVDADIIINTRSAPSIVDDVPIEKIGAVELYSFSRSAGTIGPDLVQRMFDYWKTPIVNSTAEQYYTLFGLPGGFDTVVQAGVLVLSPRHHRSLLEKVYYEYEGRPGAEWHHEMRPFSYEALKANAIHWIDQRFNWLWIDSMFMHYPFLLTSARRRSLLAHVLQKLSRKLRALNRDDLHNACLQATFLSNYFLHFGGGVIADLARLDTNHASWLDTKL
jgi:hypothetical protein